MLVSRTRPTHRCLNLSAYESDSCMFIVTVGGIKCVYVCVFLMGRGAAGGCLLEEPGLTC